MKRVLFVDDEVRILQGLRRTLRPLRHEWDMHFAEGGRAALELLAAQPFDVIVTDMLMPGMDGAELLARCKQEHPGMIRIVLSGHVDPEMGMRTVAVAHQFLHKPCDPERLRRVVARSGELQNILAENELQRLLGDIDGLPVPPRTYQRLSEALQDPDVALERVAEIIESSPMVAAKVLQLVNSAFIGVQREVNDITQAIRLLGLNILRDLVLLEELVRCLDPARLPPAFSPAAFERHAHAVSVLARRFFEGTPTASIAFTAGILHDLGEMVLAVHHPELYGELHSAAIAQETPREQVEYQRLGFSHAEVGAYLLGLWGLPHAVIEAVAFHHRPSLLPEKDLDAVTAVHVADVLVHQRLPEPAGPRAVHLDEDYLSEVIDPERLDTWRTRAEQTLGSTPTGVER